MIPFNKPALVGPELDYIRQALEAGHLSGNGGFTRRCHQLLTTLTGSRRAMLTHSCTSALEMAAILAKVGPGDEIIMPSFTFVSTANAFVLRGATPVFVDVRSDCFNLDDRLVEQAITPRTRAIVPVHYAGVACEMTEIQRIATRHDILVIEDAAQALGSSYHGRALGSFGDMAALSFHETKNIISGEGGALLVNDPALESRAEVIWEKGTDRAAFFRGDVDKYTWVDLGSSFLPSEVVAAFLCAQLESAHAVTERRRAMWRRYHDAFAVHESEGKLRRPFVPEHCWHNGHMYYVLVEDLNARTALLASLRRAGVGAVFHYVPLHSAPAGRRYGRHEGPLPVTDSVSDCLVRLPLWPGMEPVQQQIIDAVAAAL